MKPFRFLILSTVVGCLGVGCADHLQPSTPGLGTVHNRLTALQGAGLGTIQRYEVGIKPAICLGYNVVAVEVHQGKKDEIYYRVTNNDAVLNAKNESTKQVKDGSGGYLSATDPAVSINNQARNTFVIVCVDLNGKLKYVVGRINLSNNIYSGSTWGANSMPGNGGSLSGNHPSVAFMSWNRVIVAFEASDSDDLYYMTGTFNDAQDSINWDGDPILYGQGKDPSISVNNLDDGNTGQLVEVHKAADSNTLWMGIGQIIENKDKLTWAGSAVQYATGKEPSISIDDDGTVVEMHTSETENYIYRIGGYIENNQFYNQFNQKLAPAVTSASVLKNGRLLTVLGNGDSTNPQLFYSILYL